MRLKRSISYLAAGIAIVILFFFYFPWVPTSIRGAETVSISGSDMAAGTQRKSDLRELTSRISEPFFVNEQGDPKLYVIPGAALVALFMALVGYFSPKLLTNTNAMLAYLVPSLFGMVLMFWKYSQISEIAAEKGTEAAETSLIVVSYSIGWYATFAALITLFALGAILFLDGAGAKKPDKLAEAAKLNREKLATTTMPTLDPAEQTLALLAEASKLIKAKRYHIAKEILTGLEHPTAERWLNQINDILLKETQETITSVYQTSEMQVVLLAFETNVSDQSPDAILVKLAAAKNLITAKRYSEARRLLGGIDHPTARRWLAKLEEVQRAA